MRAWTKGPWQVNHSDRSQVCDCDGEVRGCSPIAYTVGDTIGERRANAHLIAAAPDLAEACEAAIEHMEWSTPQGKEAYDALQAALAKARGES